MAQTTNQRIGLFIDGANLYTALTALDMEIDYRKLLEEFRKQGQLVRANYYTALMPDHANSPLKPLFDWLGYNGFVLISKTAKEYSDPQTGGTRIKGNMDVEIAVDALQAADWLDHLVLFSGDGDFCALLRAVQQKGVRVTVISTAKSHPSIIADELRRQADEFIDLADLRAKFGKNT